MEYAYAVMILAESGEEINEQNIKGVLSAANVDIVESRVKAFVAALENVEMDRLIDGEVDSAVTGETGDGPPLGERTDQELSESDGGT